MAYIDTKLKDNLKEVVRYGCDMPIESEDGGLVNVRKIFGVLNRYDLAAQFPATTMTPVNVYEAFEEVLYIFKEKASRALQKMEVVYEDDLPTTPEGKKSYKTYMTKMKNVYPSAKFVPFGKDKIQVCMDQVDKMRYRLKNRTFDCVTSLSFHGDDILNLESITFNITESESGTLLVNMTVNQKREDLIRDAGRDTVIFSLLLKMVAQSIGLHVGKLVQVVTEGYILEDDYAHADALIKRPFKDAPKIWLNPSVKEFYKFKVSDLLVKGYEPGAALQFDTIGGK